MKSVFSTAESAIHVWASRQQCGRNSSGNVFFDRASIWSYGNHFRMAQFVTNDRGDVACLVNPDSYSVTTSRHQSMVRAAIPSYVPTFAAPRAELNHAATLEWYEAEMVDAMRKASRAHKHAVWHVERARGAIDAFNHYAEFFALPDRMAMPANAATAIAAAEAREAARKAQEAAADAERARLAAIEARQQKRRDADLRRQWRAGKNVLLPWSARCGAILLRLRGDVIQTSAGAEVPLVVAPMLWQLIEQTRAESTAAGCKAPLDMTAGGTRAIRIGHFELRTIHANGDVQIGCHFIRYAELLRMADALGFTRMPVAA